MTWHPHRQKHPTESLEQTFARLRVVLVEPTYDGNLGQVARAMRNFGLTELALVGGKADPNSDEARWYGRAEGAGILDRAQRFETLEAAVADCKCVIGTSRRVGQERGPATEPEPLWRELRPWRDPWTTALVFGREANGLYSHELDLCQHAILLPTDPGCPSLNLSHAVAVLGYTLAQAARADLAHPPSVPELVPAAHDITEAMYAHARRVWVRIGYILTPNPDTFLRRWRRIFGRARLTESEVRVVRALLHQTDWVAEIAGLPQGGAKEAGPGVFDKHKVHLSAPEDEREP